MDNCEIISVENGSTQVYFVAAANFTVSTLAAYGSMFAKRAV